MTTKANRIERYYDTHEMPGSEGLSQTPTHFAMLFNLNLIIKAIFHGQKVGITSRSNIWLNQRTREAPDIAVIDGLDMKISDAMAEDYRIGRYGAPPRVVIEITSTITYNKDLNEKPAIYNRMGVSEYFVFGPKNEPVWSDPWDKFNRLVGWRRTTVSGKYELLEKDTDGRLWSEELQSWLVIEGTDLQLYTAEGQLRLPKEDAEEQRADTERRLKEAANRRAEAQTRRAEAQTRRADVEAQRAAEKARRAEELERRAARLAEQLRKLGIDPED